MEGWCCVWAVALVVPPAAIAGYLLFYFIRSKGAEGRRRECPLSVISLILGISSICFVGGILYGLPAIGLGLASLWRIRRSGDMLKGKTLAILGIVLGGAGLFMTLAGIVINWLRWHR